MSSNKLIRFEDRALRHWNGIPLIIVLLLTGWMIESPRWMPLLLMTLFGVGWVMLGYELWRVTRLDHGKATIIRSGWASPFISSGGHASVRSSHRPTSASPIV